MDATLVLSISAASLAILHTLLPDHEIPLAMIGRAQKWSIKKMAGVTLVAGVIHISVSVVIAIIALAVSSILAQRVALTAHRISGIFLIGFGLVYSVLAWRREHDHGHHHAYPSVVPEIKVGSGSQPVIGTGAWLAAIVGIAPCFTLIPILIDAMWFGTATILWVMIIYTISTIGSMVVLTSIALKTIMLLTKLEKIERHIEILAGIVILAVGLYVVLPDVLFPAHTHI